MKQLLKSLKSAKKQLIKFSKAMPNVDEFATPYSSVADLVYTIDQSIKELPKEYRQAVKDAAKVTDPMPNRAKKWCKIK
jgi:predicted S18 family serine protease